MFIVILICLLLILALCFVFTNPITKDIDEELHDDKSTKMFSFYQKTPNKTIISCNCKESQTWHTGQVQHMMVCPIFREKNPDLTFGEFMEKEGFGYPGVNAADWPP